MSDDILEILLNDRIIPNELRKKIVKEVIIKGKEEKKSPAGFFYAKAINNVNVSGFRVGSEPPVTLLIPEVISLVKKSDHAFLNLLMSWRLMQTDLREIVKDYLNDNDIKVDEEADTEKVADEILSAVKLPDNNLEYSREELRLMILLELNIPEVDDDEDEDIDFAEDFEDGETDNEDYHEDNDTDVDEEDSGSGHETPGTMGKWERIVSEVRSWSAFDIEWESLDSFIGQLQEIADEKSCERVNMFEPVVELLSKIKSMEEVIAYCGVTDLKKWEIGGISPVNLSTLHEKLFNFESHLNELDDWRIKVPETPNERKDINSKCEELEEKICSLYETLKSDFFTEHSKESTLPVNAEEDEVHEEVDAVEDSFPEEPYVEKSSANELKKQDHGQQAKEGINVDTKDLKKTDSEVESVESNINEEVQEIKTKEYEKEEETHEKVEDISPDKLEQQDTVSEVWSLISEGDLTAAYWLAESMEKEDIVNPPVPSWLIASVQGAYWMLNTDTNYIPDLSNIAAVHDTSDMDTSGQLMGLSAALIINLIAPSCGVLHWLNCPPGIWNLNQMVEYVKDFSEKGLPLLRADFQDARSEAQIKNLIQNCVEEAASIQNESGKQRLKFYRASKVLVHLYGPNGYLNKILQIVADNNSKEIKTIGEFLENWTTPDYVDREINKIDATLDKQKTTVIMGTSRDQLLRYIAQTVQVIQEWYDLNERYNKKDGKPNWHYERAKQFCEKYNELLPAVENELTELSNSSSSGEIIAAVRCLHKTVAMLGWYTGQREQTAEQEIMPHPSWWVSGTKNLHEALARRLLWFPELELNEDGFVTDNSHDKILDMFLEKDFIKRSFGELFKSWVEKQDFRFIELLRSAMADDNESQELNKYYSDMLEGSKAALRTKIKKTQAAMERAIINGIISDEQRDEYTESISVIQPDSSLNYNKHFKRLDQIQAELEEALESRLSTLTQRWNELDIKLQADSRFDAQEREKTFAFIKNEFNNKNTRVIEEFLSKLNEYIEKGGHFSLADFEKHSGKTIYKEYTDARKKIDDFINITDKSLRRLNKAIENQQTWSALRFGELPKTQLQQAKEVVKSWKKLVKNKDGTTDTEFRKMIKEILSFIGFVFEKGHSPVEKIKNEANWELIRVKMSSSDFARPFPQLGSMTNGIYDVVCIWEKPGADSIGGLLHDSHLDARNLIILYFGRMTEYQRRELHKMTRKRKMVAAVLDELLLIYLTSIRDERLKTFFHCSLPLSAINPYTPNIAGDVPSEIFYGRDEIITDLQRQDGSCLVYGGRQMGKSALLRNVMRRFHNPAMNMYAWVEDIKLIGDSSTGVETNEVWWRLRDIFVDMKLIKNTNATRREKIREQISRYMRDNSDSKVLIMFDEADNFLNRDALNNFREVDELRSLMAETSRRFKVVFTGLHHVQRFQHMPNQPLAHFGYPSLVGPLDPAAAASLVREPLEALGFALDEACVFCILSYTNYHPGLIQIFCHELVKRLYSQGKSIGSKITQEEVEMVYLNEEVRTKIKERFEWTLALDPRYQVIAWSMIFEQIPIRDSYAQVYTAGDLLEFSKYWWPAEFTEMKVDNFRGLLNEMCGLGILVTADNRYRLRSPNLVRLMGTEKDIEYKLLEISEKQPNLSEDPNSFHALISEDKKKFSPLTFAQVRNINNNRCDVGVITASSALGIDKVEDTIKKLINNSKKENQQGARKIPETLNDGKGINEWLKQFANKWNKLPEYQLTAYQFVNAPVKDLDDRIQSARNFIKENILKTKKKGLRVYFILDPAAYWDWIKLNLILKSDLDKEGSLMALTRWNELGIRQMLERLDKPSSEETCKLLFETSGGWPTLLEEIMRRCEKDYNPRKASEEVKNEFLAEGKLRSDFIKGTGIVTNIPVIEILKYLMVNKNLTWEFVTPELIEGDKTLTDEDCILALDFLKQFGIVEEKEEILTVEPVLETVNPFGVLKV